MKTGFECIPGLICFGGKLKPAGEPVFAQQSGFFAEPSIAAPHFLKRGNTIGKMNSSLPPCGVQFAGGRAGVGPKGPGAHLSLV